jgi:hypothetical protein
VTGLDLDHCPTCSRRITDTDPDGCETASGQRYCLAHLPREADPDLFDAYQKFLAEGVDP